MYCVLIGGQTIRVTRLFLADLMVCFKTKNKPFGQLSRLVICNLCWKIRRNFGRHLLGVTICAGKQNASELRHSQITPNKMNYYLPSHPDDTEELWCCHFMSGYEVLPVLAKTACCFLGVTEVCCLCSAPALYCKVCTERWAAGTCPCRGRRSLWESSVWPVATRSRMAPILVPDHVLQNPWVLAPCSEANRRELLEEGEC